MPKAKLKILAADFKKLKVAAEMNNGTIVPNGSKTIGDEAYIVVSTPSAANFFEMGKMFKVVSGNELDEPKEEVKPAAGKKA